VLKWQRHYVKKDAVVNYVCCYANYTKYIADTFKLLSRDGVCSVSFGIEDN
jgi:hypothetical protein